MSQQQILREIASISKTFHYQIACAESCTGGLVAYLLTKIPGSSLWFDTGFVTYSNSAKELLLDVPSASLLKYGAVSQEVAENMARSALLKSHANVSLSVTGIAGPSGGSIEKPVGTVWFAWADKEGRIKSERTYFPNDTRMGIRKKAAFHALNGLLLFLKTCDNLHSFN